MLIEIVKLLLKQLDILAIVDTFVDEIDVVFHRSLVHADKLA